MCSNRCEICFSGHGHIEGVKVASRGIVKDFAFGESIRIEKDSAVIGSCIVRGKNKSGVLFFNTNENSCTNIR